MTKKHWNDEMMELEKANSPSVESWDWKWRAEQAEERAKNLEEELQDLEALMEQARIAIYQIKENADSMMRNTVRLLRRCHDVLEPSNFYYDLDPNPAVRKRQIEERTATKHDLVRALKIFLETMEGRKERRESDDGTA